MYTLAKKRWSLSKKIGAIFGFIWSAALSSLFTLYPVHQVPLWISSFVSLGILVGITVVLGAALTKRGSRFDQVTEGMIWGCVPLLISLPFLFLKKVMG